MANQDYGELFCQAIDTIVEKRIEGLNYDSTVLCTIVDDSNRNKGQYVVSNGSTKFDAFSENTSYRKNNNVYVHIPRGDWNEQKTIVSKKTDKTKEAFAYKKPFDSLVDITGNLINGAIISNETGLIANGFTPNVENKYLDDKQCINLWTYNLNDVNAMISGIGSAYSAYTRLGIQAGFKAQLNPFYSLYIENDNNTDEEIEQLKKDASIAKYVVNGDYGLRLRIYTVKEVNALEDEDTNIDSSEEKGAVYDFYLNCEDMNGNPYDFQSFFQQEKIFDISGIGKIQAMQLQFYQTKGTFKDKEGNLIASKDFLNHDIKPNLFVSDPYISLGYDIEEFDKEMIQIYTLNPLAFNVEADPETKNYKEIQLRWIHKQDDGTFKSISEADKLDYEIRWYRYQLGASSADKYSGVYWKHLSKQVTDENGISSYQIEDPEWVVHNKTCTQEQVRNPRFFTTHLIPDVTLDQEHIKAVIIYKNQPYYSNTLSFFNDKEVVSKPTVDAVQALSVVCDDDTFGNYRIYNNGNSLIDSAQRNILRNFTAYFKSLIKSNITTDEENDQVVKDLAGALPLPLEEAESIEWIIPTKKTMIVLDGFKSKAELNGQDEIITDGRYFYEDSEDERIHIIRYGSGLKGNDVGKYNYQPYRIKGYYSQVDSNNTIQCKIVRQKITYTATKELTFGIQGTTGTDYTLIIDFDDASAITVQEEKKLDNGEIQIVNGKSAIVTARLYDYENKEIPLTTANVEWSWKTTDGLLEIRSIEDDNAIIATNKREIAYIGNIESPLTYSYNILQAKVKRGELDLVAYLPIPIRKNKDYAFISGTTQIIYNSAGEILDYFRNPYIMYNNNAEKIQGCSWECGNNSTKLWDDNLITNLKELITGTVGDGASEGDLKLISSINPDNWKNKTAEDIAALTGNDKLLYDAFSKVDKNIIENARNNYLYFIGYIAKLLNSEKTPYIKKSDLLTLERKNIYIFQYFEIKGQKDTEKVDEENNPIMEDYYDFINENSKTNLYKAIGDKFFDDCCFTDPYVPHISISEGGAYLTPLSFYVADSCDEVSVICSINENNENIVIWSQPLLILQNRYPSAMINKWDGSLDVGVTDPGTILAPRLVAGKKNSNDNTFSGVMLGDWEGTNSSSELTSGTGLFGYHHGEQSYGFREDGTAFIGKSGAGRISFDGTGGIIESAAYTAGESGMSINLAKGTIDAHTFKLTAGKNNTTITSGLNNTILLDSTAEQYPLQIGSNFFVSWDGTLNTKNGVFNKGKFNNIEVNSGKFTGTLYAPGTFYGANIKGGSIGIGSTVTEKETEDGNIEVLINGSDRFIVTSDGDVTCNNLTVNGGIINASGSGLNGITVNGGFTMANGGTFGNVTSNIGESSTQYTGIGMVNGVSRVIATDGNAGMSSGNSYVTCLGDTVSMSGVKINGVLNVGDSGINTTGTVDAQSIKASTINGHTLSFTSGKFLTNVTASCGQASIGHTHGGSCYVDVPDIGRCYGSISTNSSGGSHTHTISITPTTGEINYISY